MDPDEIVMEAEEQMDKALEHLDHEFLTLHTGKASPSMVEDLQVEMAAYGSSMRIKDVAAVTTPDAKSIVITPWDKSVMKDIEKGIQKANIGFNPVIQGTIIRVPVPELSGERRRELAKMAGNMAEQARVSVRHARHGALDPLKKLQKSSDISEDDLKAYEKDIQKMTDERITKIGELLKSKEGDLTTV